MINAKNDQVESWLSLRFKNLDKLNYLKKLLESTKSEEGEMRRKRSLREGKQREKTARVISSYFGKSEK